MKAQFIVTVEGHWLRNGKPVTAQVIEKDLRVIAKEGFEFLADRVTVKRLKSTNGAANNSNEVNG